MKGLYPSGSFCMFKSKIYGLILTFLATAAFTAWFFHSPTPGDYHFYQRLMSYSDAGQETVQSRDLAKQERLQVQKQFIFNQDDHRLQWRWKVQNLMFL